MKILTTLHFSILFILTLSYSFTNAQVITFSYTGEIETFTVPDGVDAINIEVRGAQGGSGNTGIAIGGLGAIMIGDFEVTPGEELQILVGGAGVNGAEIEQQGSGTGGGGSYVVYADDTPMIIAGGGGGASGIEPYLSDGGHGQITEAGQAGGPSGGAGGADGNGGITWPWEGWHSGTGGGGFFTDADANSNGNEGAFGTVNGKGIGFLNGGNGGTGGSLGRDGGFGGGGAAGFTGGGGGGYSGGGSGSSAPDDAGHSGGGGGSYNEGTDQTNTAGSNEGDGEIIITVLCHSLTVTVSDVEICFGEEITLTGESDYDGVITWGDGIVNGEPFTPDETGLIEFIASSTADGDCDATVSIFVYDTPDIEIDYDGPDPICFGDEITLSGEGADDYDWEMDVIDSEPFIPEVGTTTYTVYSTNDDGCTGSADITIEVFDLPEVDATASDEELCYDESLILTGTGATTYEWSPGSIEDGVAFTPDEEGTTKYYTVGTDDNGCIAIDSISVFLNSQIELTATFTEEILGGDGAIDLTVTGGIPAYTFDWDNDEVDDFDDDQDLIDLTGGDYTVVVMDDIGCTETITVTVSSQVSIAENETMNVSVYSNPAAQQITIQFDGAYTYELANASGAIIEKGKAFGTNEIHLADNANGIYFITVTSDEGAKTVKIVKQ